MTEARFALLQLFAEMKFALLVSPFTVVSCARSLLHLGMMKEMLGALPRDMPRALPHASSLHVWSFLYCCNKQGH